MSAARGETQDKAINGLYDYSRTVLSNAMRREATPQRMIQVFRKAALITDTNIREKIALVDRLAPEQRESNQLACSAGCVYCCYQWVRCTVPEVLAVAGFIRANWPSDEIDSLLVELAKYRVEFHTHPKGSLFALPCPLLRNNLCSVYEVRPFICRGCNSLDVEKCREGVERPSETLIPVAMPLVQIASAMRKGFTYGISDVGLESGELVFGLSLETALSRPDAGERYIAGEEVFGSDHAD